MTEILSSLDFFKLPEREGTLRVPIPNHPSHFVNVHTNLFIANEFVPASDGKTFETFNPCTGTPICRVAEAGPEDIEKAVKAAEKAFPVWSGLPHHERGRLLNKLADLVERDIDHLASIETLDNGKSVTIAKAFDVTEVVKCFRYYAGWCDKGPGGGQVIDVGRDLFCYTRKEPIGVCGAIIPWNFPLLMLAWKVAPALACGNTMVLKVAEQTPLSALALAALVREAGFPPGTLNIVPGFGPTAGAALASHPRIGKIAFTGSTATGRAIMKMAAANVTKITLELGGKSPNIVFADADLEQAVRWCAFGIFFNHGQCCCAGSRIYVQEDIYDQFVEKFIEHARTLKVGDPFEADTFQGPQVSQLQYDRVMSYIESGKEDGACVRLGGGRHGKEGYFVQPTVFTDCRENMRIMQEEIFGPVVAIQKFADIDEVIHKANSSLYGLAAAVFTRDMQRAFRISHALQAGTVWVNCYNELDYSTPFGGFKHSGIGRENGEEVLSNYLETKTVKINLGLKK
ncbi:uncharacterized protein VTP21DRAFT_5561 [Calcarisporiella thermophila]|uniref:uncharacterized protein n=1 Tax=Calcarisporiella thermophila TaxID=911321 RepID=UPI00374495EB